LHEIGRIHVIFYDDDVLHPASLTDSAPAAKMNVDGPICARSRGRTSSRSRTRERIHVDREQWHRRGFADVAALALIRLARVGVGRRVGPS
jgi:hypothetical protein